MILVLDVIAIVTVKRGNTAHIQPPTLAFAQMMQTVSARPKWAPVWKILRVNAQPIPTVDQATNALPYVPHVPAWTVKTAIALASTRANP